MNNRGENIFAGKKKKKKDLWGEIVKVKKTS